MTKGGLLGKKNARFEYGMIMGRKKMTEIIAILNTLNSSVPIGTVIVIVLLVFMANEMRHIRKDLSNHISEVKSDIKELRQDIKGLFKKI